eukprot:TRINITY_DN1997_c0_g1_i2.p1 TRINITY_DN1997_c0_g1~~TRINITY_DN1997_c0_g1_i2.p1  ORF type:complete len:506 (+),score=90.08 TRINITY_DN1997_c0_g1_i2:75-1592(+)
MKRDRKHLRSSSASEEEPSHSSGESAVPISIAPTDRAALPSSKQRPMLNDQPNLTRQRNKAAPKGEKAAQSKSAKNVPPTTESQEQSDEEVEHVDDAKHDEEDIGDDVDPLEGEQRLGLGYKIDFKLDLCGDDADQEIHENYLRFESRVLKSFAGTGFYGPTAPFALGLKGTLCDRAFQRPKEWPANREAVQQLLQPFLPPNTTRPGFVQVLTILLDHPAWQFPGRWVRRPFEFEINATLAFRWLFLAKPSLEKNLRKNRFRRMGPPFHHVHLIWPTEAAAAAYDPATLFHAAELAEPCSNNDLALMARVQRYLRPKVPIITTPEQDKEEKWADAFPYRLERPDDLTITENEIFSLSRTFQFLVSRIRRYRFPSAKRRKVQNLSELCNKDDTSLVAPQPLPTYDQIPGNPLKPKKKQKPAVRPHPSHEPTVWNPVLFIMVILLSSHFLFTSRHSCNSIIVAKVWSFTNPLVAAFFHQLTWFFPEFEQKEGEEEEKREHDITLSPP